MKLFSRLGRSASRLGRSKSQDGGNGGQKQRQDATPATDAVDNSASAATAATGATDAAVVDGEEEIPSMTKLEQTMSDLRVKEGEAGAGAAAEDDDASIPPAPPGGGVGDDSMLRGLSSLDFGGGSLSFLVGSSIGSEGGMPLPKDGSAGSTAVLKGTSSGDAAAPLNRESEDLGPGVPPLFQSDSSVNVYVPTKLRRAGSHTTGTYADPANNMRQELDTRRKEQAAPPQPGAGAAAEEDGDRPLSMSTTATGDELINMDHFNSNTSAGGGSNRVVSMQYQRAFDSNNTAYQQQQLAIAQGAVAQAGAADLVFRQPSGQSSRPTSLDGRCLDAIMALGSSGDSGGGAGGRGPGGSDSFRLSRDLPQLDSNGGVSVMSIASSLGGPPSRPVSAAMAPVPLPSSTEEDLGVSVSVAPGIESPVFQPPTSGSMPLPPSSLSQQQPPRAPQGPPLEGEPPALPNLSGSGYSGKSADWFGPEGPAPLVGGSGATAPSYINAFQNDSIMTGGSGGSGASLRQGQQQQQQPPQGPPAPLPYIMDGTQQAQQGPPHHPPHAPPPGGRIMPVPLPQGYAPPAHYNHQVMPPAPQPYKADGPGPFMGGGSGPGLAGPVNGRDGGGGAGGGLAANRSRRASSGGSRGRGASGEEDWGDDGTTATTPTNKGERAKGAGRYKCRYCGGIKRQHVCPALIDIPRASTGTQVDLALTMGQGGMPVIPVELHGCRFLTVRRACGANGADLDGAPPAYHQASLGGSGASLGSSMGSLSMQIPMVPVMAGPGPIVLAAPPGPPDGVYYQQPPQQHQMYAPGGQGGPPPQVVQYPPNDASGGYAPGPSPAPAQQQGYTDYQAL